MDWWNHQFPCTPWIPTYLQYHKIFQYNHVLKWFFMVPWKKIIFFSKKLHSQKETISKSFFYSLKEIIYFANFGAFLLFWFCLKSYKQTWLVNLQINSNVVCIVWLSSYLFFKDPDNMLLAFRNNIKNFFNSCIWEHFLYCICTGIW